MDALTRDARLEIQGVHAAEKDGLGGHARAQDGKGFFDYTPKETPKETQKVG